MDERRRFSRVIYNVPAQIHQEPNNISGSIADLSLHGLLLISETQELDLRKNINVSFRLPQSDITISLQALIVEMTDELIRAKIQHIDIESITYLKRLIELNVGNEDLLHREIEQLTDLGDESTNALQIH